MQFLGAFPADVQVVSKCATEKLLMVLEVVTSSSSRPAMSDKMWGARLANPESRIINVPLALADGLRIIITLRSVKPTTRHIPEIVLYV